MGDATAFRTAINASACASGAKGAFVTAMSSANHAPCPTSPPDCDMGCQTAGYGAEPMCCGALCQIPSCANGLWQGQTRIKLGPGSQTCGSILSSWVDGVLCCKVPEHSPPNY